MPHVRRPSHATLVAYLALFVALGGTSYAAVQLSKNSVRSTHIKNGQVKRSDLARNAVNSSRVADRSLTAADFAPGQLPAGPRGAKGEIGPLARPGPAGPAAPAGPAGSTGVLAHSYAWSIAPVALNQSPTASQVNLLNAPEPGETGGVLEVDEPGHIHVHGSVLVARNEPGSGGRVICGVRMNGENISAGSWGSFSDSGLDPADQPSRPLVTLPVLGIVAVEPGTYNVGVICQTDRDNLATMRTAEFNVVVYKE